jgi:hypothetical protein
MTRRLLAEIAWRRSRLRPPWTEHRPLSLGWHFAATVTVTSLAVLPYLLW